MKKSVVFILIGIGTLLMAGVIAILIPWVGNLKNEIGELSKQRGEYQRSIIQYANQSILVEQEKLLTLLLEETSTISEEFTPKSLEVILSSESYLAYLKTQDEMDYVDYPTYVSAMPTQKYESVVLSRLQVFLGPEVGTKKQEIWVDYYLTLRDWSKTGKNENKNSKEFQEILQTEMVTPLMNQDPNPAGFTSQILKMGIGSEFIIDDTKVFHRAWSARVNNYGKTEGLLRCAISTPGEFAVMASFFGDMESFVSWIINPFPEYIDVEKQVEN